MREKHATPAISCGILLVVIGPSLLKWSDVIETRDAHPNIDREIFCHVRDEAEFIDRARNFDVVVATHFTTVQILKAIYEVSPHFLPAYYVQDYEPWIVPEDHPKWKEAMGSYRLVPGMLIFAKTNWIRATVTAYQGVEVATLATVDVFIDMSTYQAFGRTALEAMACGAAVIAPEGCGPDEYGRDGENIRLVDTKDFDAVFSATCELIEDKEFRERIAAAAIETAAEFSVASASDSEIELFEREIERRRNTALIPVGKRQEPVRVNRAGTPVDIFRGSPHQTTGG